MWDGKGKEALRLWCCELKGYWYEKLSMEKWRVGQVFGYRLAERRYGFGGGKEELKLPESKVYKHHRDLYM